MSLGKKEKIKTCLCSSTFQKHLKISERTFSFVSYVLVFCCFIAACVWVNIHLYLCSCVFCCNINVFKSIYVNKSINGWIWAMLMFFLIVLISPKKYSFLPSCVLWSTLWPPCLHLTLSNITLGPEKQSGCLHNLYFHWLL